MKDAKQKIICRAIVEMVGAPKKHLEETMRLYINKLKEEYKDIKVLEEYISKAEKQENGKLYNLFCELELEIKGVENLVWFCFDYMPASIEISEPEELVYSQNNFTGFINDLLQKLHKVDMTLKHLAAENQVLGNNAVTLMKNIIVIQLKGGPKTAEMIAKEAGSPVEHVQKFLEVMEKDKKVKKKGKEYVLNV